MCFDYHTQVSVSLIKDNSRPVGVARPLHRREGDVLPDAVVDDQVNAAARTAGQMVG